MTSMIIAQFISDCIGFVSGHLWSLVVGIIVWGILIALLGMLLAKLEV